MTKFVKILVVLLLNSTSIFSQTKYPKTLILNSDTVVAITVEQLKKTNDIFIEKNECFEQRELQDSIIDNFHSKCESLELIINIVDSQKMNLKSQIILLESQRDETKKQNDQLITDLNKKEKKLHRRNQILIGSISINLTVIGVIILSILL